MVMCILKSSKGNSCKRRYNNKKENSKALDSEKTKSY